MRFISVALAMVFLMAGMVAAQVKPEGRKPGPGPGLRKAILDRYDADHDGRLDRKEMKKLILDLRARRRGDGEESKDRGRPAKKGGERPAKRGGERPARPGGEKHERGATGPGGPGKAGRGPRERVLPSPTRGRDVRPAPGVLGRRGPGRLPPILQRRLALRFGRGAMPDARRRGRP